MNFNILRGFAHVREEHLTSSELETRALARTLAGLLKRGDVVGLQGELGTGKTAFVKGVCEAYSAEQHVSSPSFTILNRYDGFDQGGREMLIYHLDLYRIKSLDEIYDLGYEEFFYGEGITLIEWAEQLGNLLPANRYEVHLSYGEHDSHRRIVIESFENPLVSAAPEKKAGTP
jgi:tRNA threonylcarbamoyladenosine biosynthesis protein TsaE